MATTQTNHVSIYNKETYDQIGREIFFLKCFY